MIVSKLFNKLTQIPEKHQWISPIYIEMVCRINCKIPDQLKRISVSWSNDNCTSMEPTNPLHLEGLLRPNFSSKLLNFLTPYCGILWHQIQSVVGSCNPAIRLQRLTLGLLFTLVSPPAAQGLSQYFSHFWKNKISVGWRNKGVAVGSPFDMVRFRKLRTLRENLSGQFRLQK